MLKNIFILILIVILAAFGMAAAFRLLSWLIGMIINIAIVVVVFLGVMYLIRKLRSG
jgi:hypothetical protein